MGINLPAERALYHFARPHLFSRKTTPCPCSDKLSAKRLSMNRMAWNRHVERGVVVRAIGGSAGVAYRVSLTAETGGTIHES
jgi:hypothetical protein